MLFAEGERGNYNTQSGPIPNFIYWDQSARPLAELMRFYIEIWATYFEADAEFISKFKSKRDDHHEAALFELTAHAALRNADLHVLKLPRGDAKMPDFQVWRQGDQQRIFVECTLSADSFNSAADKAKKNEILEVIEGLDYFPYFVNVEFVEISKQSISKTKLKAKFLARGEPVNTSVSAVVFCQNFHVLGLFSTKITVWHNSFAANPLSPGILPFDEYVFSVNEGVLSRMHQEKRGDVFQLLGISEELYKAARNRW